MNTFVYEVGDGLYVNLTNRCPCACRFCIRTKGDGAYGSDSLWLEREPSAAEVCADVDRMLALLREAFAQAAKAGDEEARRRIRWYASGFEPFLSESAANAGRTERKVVRPGETNEMVAAQSVDFPKPWAKTRVSTSVEDDSLCFRVRCDDPAAARMNFDKRIDDFVWGNDRVTFAVEDDGAVRMASVYLTGEVVSKDVRWARGDGFSARVTHDVAGWTVEAKVRLSARAREAGEVRGNVCRWRVGDRKLPEAERVPGSRYEHARLDTRFTVREDDPAAFVVFRLVGPFKGVMRGGDQ